MAELSPRDWKLVAAKLDRLAADPGAADIRKMAGHAGEWRLRAGKWRARFTFQEDTRTVVVLHVLRRSRAYRD